MPSTVHTLMIPEWANGPDGSGNGGWSAGLLAAQLDAETVAVSLRVPPPIGRSLQVVRTDVGLELHDGDVLVADAVPATLDATVLPDAVRAIRPDDAAAASAGFPFRDHHPFPRCVACGIARDPEQPSLQLHAGPVEGVFVDDLDGEPVPVFADSWLPTAEFADPADPDRVRREACWSALDCPSAAPVADPHAPNPSVLARIGVRLEQAARVGERCVVAAWRQRIDGRKQFTRSVLLQGGEVLGVADALWIEVRQR